MADINMKDFVDALTADTSPESTDLVYVRTSAGNRKMTVQNLLNGIGSLAIKTGNGGDIGGYLFDKVDDGIIILDDDNLDFGTSDFSIEVYFQVNSTTGYQTLVNKGSLGGGLGYSLAISFDASFIQLSITDTATGEKNCNLILTTSFSTNTCYHLVVVADRDGNAVGYLNGVLTGESTDISAYSTSISTNYGVYIGKNFAAGYFSGRIFLVRLYNRVLTSTEIASIYNNGRPDLYELPMSLRGASNTSIAVNGSAEGTYSSGLAPNWGTAGTITNTEETGRSGSAQGFTSSVNVSGGNIRCNTTGYKIGQIVYIEFYYKKISGSGDKFYILNRLTGTVVQIANVTTDWQKYSTTVTVTNTGAEGLFFGMDFDQIDGSVYAIDDVVFTKFGCVAEYLPRNAGSLGWIESSGNQLSGSTSGSPLCINTENRPPQYRDIRKAIAANTNTTLTGIVPKGYKIVSIRAKGSDSLADIKIGTASAGEQIVAATTTSSTTPKLLTLAATANDAYSESADVTLYARHDTSASGKTMDLIFHFEKVGN